MFKIYKITNTINGSQYVGFTSLTSVDRYKEHLKNNQRKTCSSHLLYKAFKKYGVENFSVEEIGQAKTKEEAWERECYWISHLRTNRFRYPEIKGYNMNDGGTGGPGYKHTEESLEKMRLSSLGRKHTDLTKKKISEANRGKPKSEYVKQRASETHRGKTLSIEHRQSLSRSTSYRNNHLTPEQRKVLSERAATARRVAQMLITGDLIKVFDQIKHASASSGLSTVAISNACRGKWKQAGGFVWKFVE